MTPVATVDALTIYKTKVMLVAPWYKNVTAPTAFSWAQLRDRRRTTTFLNYGDAFISHTRNRSADLFLKSDCEYMLTIDDDMVVPFGNARWFKTTIGFSTLNDDFAKVNALDRLMSHGKTLVGALYFGRWRSGRPVFNEAFGNPVIADQLRKSGPINELRPTRWVGTGCLLIHRSVFEDIEKKFPALARDVNGINGQWFSPSEHEVMDAVNRVVAHLGDGAMTAEKALRAYNELIQAQAQIRRSSNLGKGEDATFCIRAGQAGHQPYVDLGCLCGHLGQCVYGPHNTHE